MKTIGLAIFLFFLACSSKKSSEGVSSVINSGNRSMVRGNTDTNHLSQEKSNNISNPHRKLIKKGSLTFQTDNLEVTHNLILATTQKYNGYVSLDNGYQNNYRESKHVTVRIPSVSFDEFLSILSSKVKKFENKNIQVNDVTEEFLDVQTRLKVKKSLEAKYTELLKKAKSIKEVLEVEKELNEVRTIIESTEGRLKYLKNQVSYSTLDIEFYKLKPASAHKDSFFKRLTRAFGGGIENIKSFIIGLVHIWPFLIIIFVIIFFIVRRKRKKTTK